MLIHLLVTGINTQINVRGSSEATQGAVNSFQFIIAAPKNCLETIADLPSSVSKNMAALWIRAAFHDAGTWSPTSQDHPGGADASLMQFLNAAENAGLEESIAPRFMQNPKVNMSKADMIALAGQVSITHCGGPNFPFRAGRQDASTHTSPVGRLPSGNIRLPEARPIFERMGWNNEDIVVLVTGSHTMGGVHKANSPEVTNQTFVPFDDTAGIFDNHVFKYTLKNKCAIPLDCDIANDPVLRPIVEKYAIDQNAFFEQYKISYQKLIGQTNSPLGDPQNLKIDPHLGLFNTPQPPTEWGSIMKPSSPVVSVTPPLTGSKPSSAHIHSECIASIISIFFILFFS